MTSPGLLTHRPAIISTHTPSWGVTIDINTRIENIRNFYSHALVGRDEGKENMERLTYISTHTPSWGVTRAVYLAHVLIIFLLTRPRGA